MESLRRDEKTLHLHAVSFHYREFQPSIDVLKPFDCGKADLNGFLLETTSDTPNATMYEREHLGKTYIVEEDGTGVILAYFCLLYDKIERAVADPEIWNRLSRKIPNAKRRSSYPSLKIGRLAVNKSAQNSGLGHTILTFIKGWFFKNSKAGCRFLTVDAYLDAEGFYEESKFSPLLTPDSDDETILMFFDLKGIE